jgi:hypothetical protein
MLRAPPALRSLIVPALLSAASFGATILYFQRAERDAGGLARDAKPIAYLKTAKNQIERRQKARVIWQDVDAGAAFYPGDAIRTSATAEGSVQLVKEGTTLTLEADSLIVLEEGQSGGLELNLVSGSLLVDASGAPAAGGAKSAALAPVIKAGGTKVSLAGGSQLSLTKQQGKDATIAVTKGQVEVKAGDKAFKVDEGKAGTLGKEGVATAASLAVLAPKPNESVVVNRLPGGRLAFTFAPAPAAKEVRLELGASRTALVDVGVAAPGASGGVSAKVPLGTFYWRLVGYDASRKVVASTIAFRAEGLYVAPPELYAPGNGAVIVPRAGQSELSLTWSRPERAAAMTLEVATDATFATKIAARDVGLATDAALPLPKEGRYAWRVSATYDGVDGRIASAPRAFEIRRALELAAPRLTAPAEGARVAAAAVRRGGLELVWEKVDGATAYEVQVVRDARVRASGTESDPRFVARDLPQGAYLWRVRAAAEGGATGKWSAARRFSVDGQAELRWTEGTTSPRYFLGGKPHFDLRWQSGPADARRWRLRYSRSKEGLATAAWTVTLGPGASLTHERDGAYWYEAQALSGGGDVLGGTKPLRVEHKERPPLPPPAFVSTGAVKARADGSATLRWGAVKDAASYELALTRLATSETVKLVAAGLSYDLKDLLPGKYEVKVRTVDEVHRAGAFGPARTIVVPAHSDVPPPAKLDFKVH